MAVSQFIRYKIPLESVTVDDQRRIPFIQGDKIAHVISIDTGDADLAASVSGGVVRADGTIVGLTGTVSGGVATVSIPAAAYNITGRITIIIRFTTSDIIRTALVLHANVVRGDDGDIVESTTTVGTVSAVVGQATQIRDYLDSNYADIRTKLSGIEIATDAQADEYLGVS